RGRRICPANDCPFSRRSHLVRQRKAAAAGRSLTALIEGGLRRVVKDAAAAGGTERVLPIGQFGDRGLRPRIDLDDSEPCRNWTIAAAAGRARDLRIPHPSCRLHGELRDLPRGRKSGPQEPRESIL